MPHVTNNKKHPPGAGVSRSLLTVLEASGGFEPPIRVLQTPALPLGYDAVCRFESGFYHLCGPEVTHLDITPTSIADPISAFLPHGWETHHDRAAALLRFCNA